MEEAVQLLLQGGALGLLAYLIWWTTRDGAPQLFTKLGGIQSAIESHSNRLANLEAAMKELRQEMQRITPTREQ